MKKKEFASHERLDNIDAMIRQYLAVASDLLINIRVMLELRKVLINKA